MAFYAALHNSRPTFIKGDCLVGALRRTNLYRLTVWTIVAGSISRGFDIFGEPSAPTRRGTASS
jgi:hypothetical protein